MSGAARIGLLRSAADSIHFKKMAFFRENGLAKGLEMVLNHHLEECADRYKQYMERHDSMWRKMEDSERERVVRWDALRKEIQKDMDHQTQQMRSTMWRVVSLLVSIAALAGTLGNLFIHHIAP